jgi:uncharacterized protein with HEPN domain
LPPKDDLVYLGHMLDMAQKIAVRTAGLTRTAFDEDEDLRLALAHLIQIIGEAARRVSDEGRTRYPAIPWRELTGIRSKIVHDYMSVSFDVVWAVVTEDVPPLKRELERVVPAEEE